jgi:hypothetical protein
MTWREMHLSLQLAAEERAGYLMRERQREAKAIEDAAFDALRGAVT